MSGYKFKGTSSEQDPNYVDERNKILKEMKFPEIYYEHITIEKINLEIIKAWIISKMKEIFENEDEILLNMIINFLKMNGNESDARELYLDVEPFFEDKTKPPPAVTVH